MDRVKDKMEATQSTRLDEILATDDEIVPSSGFLSTVMEQVQEEASAPPPIPFPWTWAVAGILLIGGVFGWGAFEIFRPGGLAVSLPTLSSVAFTLPQIPALFVGPVKEVGWVALAGGVSLLCWLFSRRLAGSGGLL